MESAGEGGSMEDVFHDTTGAARGTRVMLLQISDRDISLISLDNKHAIFDRRFKDIASVSQVSSCVPFLRHCEYILKMQTVVFLQMSISSSFVLISFSFCFTQQYFAVGQKRV